MSLATLVLDQHFDFFREIGVDPHEFDPSRPMDKPTSASPIEIAFGSQPLIEEPQSPILNFHYDEEMRYLCEVNHDLHAYFLHGENTLASDTEKTFLDAHGNLDPISDAHGNSDADDDASDFCGFSVGDDIYGAGSDEVKTVIAIDSDVAPCRREKLAPRRAKLAARGEIKLHATMDENHVSEFNAKLPAKRPMDLSDDDGEQPSVIRPRTSDTEEHARTRSSSSLPDEIANRLKSVSNRRPGPTQFFSEKRVRDLPPPSPGFGLPECQVPGRYPCSPIPTRSNFALLHNSVYLKYNTPCLIEKLLLAAVQARERAVANGKSTDAIDAELQWRSRMLDEYKVQIRACRLAWKEHFNQEREPSNMQMLPDIALLADWAVKRYNVHTYALSHL